MLSRREALEALFTAGVAASGLSALVCFAGDPEYFTVAQLEEVLDLARNASPPIQPTADGKYQIFVHPDRFRDWKLEQGWTDEEFDEWLASLEVVA